jgi:dihydroorotate dehydrogenase electron transfer subunit
MVTALLAGSSGRADQNFACGPLPMYRAMSGMPELKNRPVQVSMEVVMGCGRGICYGCTIKTKNGLKKVCQDGPVFDLADIIWEQGSRP